MGMHEAILDLKRIPWSPQKEAVRVFYKEMWDNADISFVPRLFHPDFTFRGSLGPELVGYEQFIGYVHHVTAALDHYTTDILALVEEGNEVLQPTGRHVWWHGTPVFTFDGPRIRDLWVLGDLHNLVARLRDERTNSPGPCESRA
jgi:hypothetical protein